jgi:hypothetical protein
LPMHSQSENAGCVLSSKRGTIWKGLGSPLKASDFTWCNTRNYTE